MIRESDLIAAFVAAETPEGVTRNAFREAVQSTFHEVNALMYRDDRGEAGFWTFHLDMTGHVGIGDSTDCESWPEDHSGVTFEVSEGACAGRSVDTDQPSDEYPGYEIVDPATYLVDAVADAMAWAAEGVAA